MPFVLLAPASRFQESQPKIEYDSSSAFLHGTLWHSIAESDMWHFSWNLHALNWWKVGFTSHLARQRTCHRVVPVEFRRVSALSVLASARPRRYRHFVDELHLFFLPGFCGQFGLGEPASASVVALHMSMNCSSGISNLEKFFFCLLTWSTFLLDVWILFHCTFILMILTFTASSTRLFT